MAVEATDLKVLEKYTVQKTFTMDVASLFCSCWGDVDQRPRLLALIRAWVKTAPDDAIDQFFFSVQSRLGIVLPIANPVAVRRLAEATAKSRPNILDRKFERRRPGKRRSREWYFWDGLGDLAGEAMKAAQGMPAEEVVAPPRPRERYRFHDHRTCVVSGDRLETRWDDTADCFVYVEDVVRVSRDRVALAAAFEPI